MSTELLARIDKNRVYCLTYDYDFRGTEYLPFTLFQNSDIPSNDTMTMTFLILEQLDKHGTVIKQYDLSKIPACGLVIGRADDCDIQVTTSKYIGRHHAIIGKDSQGIFIQDNNSTNGIFDCNEQKKSQIDLKNGECFYLADTKFCIKSINPFKQKSETKFKMNEKLHRI